MPGSDEMFMWEAIKESRKALKKNEVPIGAVVVKDGRVIGRGWNQVETLKDATAHAEMLALTAAQNALEDWRLEGCTLYVTKEPCPMCAGAIVHCRPDRVVFGCPDPKGGAAGGWINLLQSNPPLNHHCEISSGVLGEMCLHDIQVFFRTAREAAKERKRRAQLLEELENELGEESGNESRGASDSSMRGLNGSLKGDLSNDEVPDCARAEGGEELGGQTLGLEFFDVEETEDGDSSSLP